jgi:hypothetical protein
MMAEQRCSLCDEWYQVNLHIQGVKEGGYVVVNLNTCEKDKSPWSWHFNTMDEVTNFLEFMNTEHGWG